MRIAHSPEPRRYWTLFAVLMFHAGLIIALEMITGTLRLSTPMPMMSPIELLPLPSAPPSKARPAPLEPHPIRREAKPNWAPPSTITLPRSADPDDSAGPLFDWASEAEDVAKVPAPEFQPLGGRPRAEPSTPSKSIFEDGPAHHAGEQLKTAEGRWAVFISDYCYQVTEPLASADALENGMGLQTYCTGPHHEPRDDLFDQLAAYERYHASR